MIASDAATDLSERTAIQCWSSMPVKFGRIGTDDLSGKIRAYVGEGSFTDDPLDTFGTKAVVQVPRLPELMRYICRNGFEHHAAMTGAHCAGAVTEGLGNYLGWDMVHHG